MWDCVHLVDDAAAEEIERRGGLAGIAISHPHYYTGMVDWARRFDCPVYIHADDERWIMRPDPAIELWDGDVQGARRRPDARALRRSLRRRDRAALGGRRRGRGVLLSGDIVQVIPDRSHVGFMYSYPNLIPLPASAVEAIAGALAAVRRSTSCTAPGGAGSCRATRRGSWSDRPSATCARWPASCPRARRARLG